MRTFKPNAAISLLLISILIAANALADPIENIILTPSQVEQDIQLAKETYQRLHPGYTRYSDLPALNAGWQYIIDRAKREEGLSRGDFYLEISKALTQIRCDHTKAELPEDMSKDRDQRPVYLPAKIELVERRGFVRTTTPGSVLQVQDEIVSIDGRPFEGLLRTVEPFVPFDGFTVWSRESGLTESLEFKGGAIDHFGALLFDIKTTALVNVNRRDPDSNKWQSVDIEVERINHSAWLALESDEDLVFDGIPAKTAANFKDGVFLSQIDSQTAYLRVDTFVNYRNPVDPNSVFAPIFKRLKDSRASTLILDLRRNGGGSNDAQHNLIAHLIKKKMRPIREMRVSTLNLDGLREHLSTWDKRALNPNRLGFRKNNNGTWSMRRFVSDDMDVVKPARYAFTGKILALTSTGNSSGTTSLLSVLKSHADLTLVGEKTGGSAEGPTAGLLFTLTLPQSGIKTRVPFFHILNNITEFEFGLGLTPDVIASQTVSDHLAGEDTALNMAIDIARNRPDDSG